MQSWSEMERRLCLMTDVLTSSTPFMGLISAACAACGRQGSALQLLMLHIDTAGYVQKHLPWVPQ